MTCCPPTLRRISEKAEYEASGGHLSIGDWRRAHVDALISSVYSRVHKKTGCVFGVSPSHDYAGTGKRGTRTR